MDQGLVIHLRPRDAVGEDSHRSASGRTALQSRLGEGTNAMAKTGAHTSPTPHVERRLQTVTSVRQDAFEVSAKSPYWLKVAWRLTEKTLNRAVAGMGPDWHRSRPVLRVSQMACDESGPHAKQVHSDIELPPDCSEWYVNVPGGIAAWGVELGYLSSTDKFFSLLHSPAIVMPSSSGGDHLPVSRDPTAGRSASGREQAGLSIAAELLMHGTVSPSALVTIDGSEIPIETRSGKFEWRTRLGDGRIVVPIEARTDCESRRVLLAIDSNLRFLEPEHLTRH